MMRPGGALLLVSAMLGCGGGQKTRSLPSGEQEAPAVASLLERMGGMERLRRLVDEWMLEIASDERIQEHFVEVDISTLKLRLVERVCVLAGGPCVYRGRDLDEAHARLRIGEAELKAFIEDLDPALERAGVRGDEASELRVRVRELAAELAIAASGE